MSYSYPYPRPAFTVDAIVYDPESKHILLIQRGQDPFVGKWALPGGFLDMDETPEQAVLRELKEETGLVVSTMTQMHTFGDINRDPRHRTITTAFVAIQEGISKSEVKGMDDAQHALWFPLDRLPELAFDHLLIIDFFKQTLQ